jgi:predicted transcriptional regulator
MTFDLFRRNFVVSIHPMYASKIISGEKTVELRRRFSLGISPGSRAYIYATNPVKAVIGWATVSGIERLNIETIKRRFKVRACITDTDFDTYFGGLEQGFAIELKEPYALLHPVSASELKLQSGFLPPQSYRYASEGFLRLMEDAGGQNTASLCTGPAPHSSELAVLT